MTKKTLLVATISFLYLVPWLLIKAWIFPLPDTLKGQLDEAVDHGFSGIIVYVKQASQPAQHFASGWHGREAKIPARPEALFKLTSISKLYDAVAVTKLVSDGRLSLDKTAANYLPELVGRIEYAGGLPEYQSYAKCHKYLNAVAIQFYSTTVPKVYYWNLSEVINNRIVKILKKIAHKKDNRSW